MEEDFVMIPGSGTKKIIRDVKKEIETAFLDYSMSVIVSRALPDVRDGLKPVHRRILYTMHERGNDPSHPYRKSADTVGAVLGSYHPHGDVSVYDAMVRLAQDFSLRYPLVDGQGNFGSVDGDPPAAYRYTEARMSRMAVEMLTDIEKDTIDWDPNFDETKKEPSVLPCRFPNLLVNGSQGIAVGMATNIPPHNLSEVIDGCIAYIDDPDIDLPGLMEYIKGPDFPTAGIIMGRSGIRAAYATGRGCPTDLRQAQQRLKRAALKGSAKAALALSELNLRPDNPQADSAEALHWCAEAARGGLAAAQLQLAFFHWRGDGVRKSADTACDWARRSALQGYLPAFLFLAKLLTEGETRAGRLPAEALALLMKVRSVLTDRDARGDGKDTAELLAQCRIRCDELTAELSATEIERAKRMAQAHATPEILAEALFS